MTFTVVVLGFYGSKRRHGEKYAKAWEEHVPGVKKCIINECSGTFTLLTMGFRRDARKVLEELKGETTVVFHVLSNRGMAVYIECVRLLPKETTVAGVVFDSCPGAISPFLFFKATAANEKNLTLKRLHEAMPYLIFLVFAYQYGIMRSILVHIFLEFNQRIWTKLYHFYVAKRDPAACPSLFLYSTADELVAYDLVEACANAREQAFGRVWRKRWQTSPHVRHIYDFEDEYVAELKNFAANLEITN